MVDFVSSFALWSSFFFIPMSFLLAGEGVVLCPTDEFIVGLDLRGIVVGWAGGLLGALGFVSNFSGSTSCGMVDTSTIVYGRATCCSAAATSTTL